MEVKELPKKETIMQVASNLFAQKGYEYTSVDEIAKECGISKGSFYKYFPSKEDLLIEVFKEMPSGLKMFLQKIHSSNYDSPSEKLSEFISVALKHMLNDKRFYYLDIHTLYPTLVKNKLEDKIAEVFFEINLYLKEFLLDLYGNHIKDYEEDLIFILRGIIVQFVQLYRFSQQVDLQKSVTFFVTVFEIIVHGLIEKKPDPFIHSDWDIAEILDEFNSPLYKALRIQRILEKIEHEIKSSSIKTDQKDQYLKAASLLADECRSYEPKEFLVNALITYIKDLPNTQKYCDELLDEISNYVNYKFPNNLDL
ncbi:TetR/AcrR family transcriptional regulator [Lysinibacillus telephonicus]|uniref:TetR/AcrR family transcriptional regulator n=1 Tax=Lysinibacillus telephonicus TaxID=1714840 RepID=A0A3S0JHE4_9BACI|nr:TetR/AcrR family transcriptional regulator [Lysinibacillus telephonicus]